MKVASILALLIFAAGCSHYEYDITRPSDLAAHVGTNSETSFSRDPLEYHLISYDDRLVMKIENKSDDAIQLVGEQSSVVDPNGQSHPLRSQAIAPNSFIKLIFPPLRPTIERTGPSFGIGIGTVIGDRRHLHDDVDDFGYDEAPRYLTVVDDDAVYWNWTGEGEIRLALSFSRKSESFKHEFVIRRVKGK